MRLPSERRDLIAARLLAGQNVSAVTLAEEFGVSEDAIRRDLRSLAAAGTCRRVYGGALPVSTVSKPLTERIDEHTERKQALAIAAVGAIQRNSLVFIDSGSANLAVVAHLPDGYGLTIATNSVPAAAAALRRPDLRLIIVGGEVNHLVGGCIDATATAEVARMTIDYCFLGACAVSSNGGVTAVDFGDAKFKRDLIARSRVSIVLATSDKLGTDAAHQVADLADVGTIVVEHDAPDSVTEDFARSGVAVLRAGHPA